MLILRYPKRLVSSVAEVPIKSTAMSGKSRWRRSAREHGTFEDADQNAGSARVLRYLGGQFFDAFFVQRIEDILMLSRDSP